LYGFDAVAVICAVKRLQPSNSQGSSPGPSKLSGGLARQPGLVPGIVSLVKEGKDKSMYIIDLDDHNFLIGYAYEPYAPPKLRASVPYIRAHCPRGQTISARSEISTSITFRECSYTSQAY